MAYSLEASQKAVAASPPQDQAAPREMSAARQRLTVLLVAGGAFIATLDVFIVNVAFSKIHQSFPDSSPTQLSWVLSAYSIVFAALLVPAGRLADRLGRRTLFRLGMVLFASGSVGCALAPSVAVLIGARAFQAIGGALMVPTSLGLLLAAYPRERHRQIVSWWSAISTTAAACGPPLGGLLADVDWRWIFLINLPIAIPVVLAGRLLPDDEHDPGSGLPDFLGAALLALGIGGLVAGLSATRTLGWADGRLWALFAFGALGVTAFLVRCAHHPRPVVDLALLRVPQFAAANATMMLFGIGFAGALLAGPMFMQQIWGYSASKAGIAYLPGPITATILALVTARMAMTRRTSSVIGCLCFAGASFWWAALLEHNPSYLIGFLPGGLLVGCAVGLTMAATMGVGTASVPPSQYSTGSGIMNTSRQIGTAITVAIVVAILGNGISTPAFHQVYVLTGVAALLAAITAARLSEPIPPEA